MKKTLSEREHDRYVTMTDIVLDLNADVPRIHRLIAQKSRWDYPQSNVSRRSKLHRFLGCGLLNKGYLKEALVSFKGFGLFFVSLVCMQYVLQ